MQHNQEDILDDGEIKNKLLAPLENELGKLRFWLIFSIFLLVICGVFGILLCVEMLRDLYFWSQLLFLTGMTAAFITAFPMAYSHFRYAQNCKNFCSNESDEHFDELMKSSANDWRLLAFAFIFVTVAVAPFTLNECYKDWQRNSYIQETPPELPEPNLDNLPTIETEIEPQEVQPIEDPAPESE